MSSCQITHRVDMIKTSYCLIFIVIFNVLKQFQVTVSGQNEPKSYTVPISSVFMFLTNTRATQTQAVFSDIFLPQQWAFGA